MSVKKGIDLTELYSLRSKFTIVGLTGRTSSGCTYVADLFGKGFSAEYPVIDSNMIDHNSYRKYRIVREFCSENFKPYQIIKYKHILVLFILKNGFEKFIEFLGEEQLLHSFLKSKLRTQCDFSEEIIELQNLKIPFEKYCELLREIDFGPIKKGNDIDTLYNVFFSTEFESFSDKLHDALSKVSNIKRIKVLQLISNNLRNAGQCYSISNSELLSVYTIVNLTNKLIKAYRNKHIDRCQIVIDSLRNPLEIMYLKERYSAFYMMAVNRQDDAHIKSLEERYNSESDAYDIHIIDKEEHKGGEEDQFYMQNVTECIQKSDIHINHLSEKEAREQWERIKELNDNTTPRYSTEKQILKYVALIGQPGIIPPSAEERCMQIAYTAKYNSGCISRQVGAVVTDVNYSIKSIGWNNTPEGQVPCVLRNANDLLDKKGDLNAYSQFEQNDKEFKQKFTEQYKNAIEENSTLLKGRNVCYCFKTIRNSYSEGKNQVHTRSLHAEENAFLQITKYGGDGIRNGKLFSTASPCELCSKKAYQLGIKVIYYIDPYPGIAIEHILKGGEKKERNPDLRLFNGAIGKAYHRLYEPFMAYKDELSLILNTEIDDLTKKYKKDLIVKQKEVDDLKALLAEKETK